MVIRHPHEARRRGRRRRPSPLHILAWRDLDDIEAGGSEVHADQVARRWAEAGLDVVHADVRAHGQVTDTRRNGYRVIRRAGRHTVFLDAPVQELLRRTGRARRAARGVERASVLRAALGHRAHARPSSTTSTPTCGGR